MNDYLFADLFKHYPNWPRWNFALCVFSSKKMSFKSQNVSLYNEVFFSEPEIKVGYMINSSYLFHILICTRIHVKSTEYQFHVISWLII